MVAVVAPPAASMLLVLRTAREKGMRRRGAPGRRAPCSLAAGSQEEASFFRKRLNKGLLASW